MPIYLVILAEVTKEGLIHTATMLPILIAVFLLVERVSHRTDAAWLRRGLAHPYLGPLVGAGLGLLPQCGFSIAATSLFVEGFIPTGSLLASYIATSDEAVPILLGNSGTRRWVAPLLGVKLIWGLLVGVAVNLVARKASKGDPRDQEKKSEEREPGGFWRETLPHALGRAIRVATLVFVLSVAFNFAGHLMGDRLMSGGLGALHLPMASVIGLFPSCATSVVLSEAFGTGLISFPALVSGLTANAGMGLFVLAKECKDRSRVLGVVFLLVLSAVLSGALVSFFVS